MLGETDPPASHQADTHTHDAIATGEQGEKKEENGLAIAGNYPVVAQVGFWGRRVYLVAGPSDTRAKMR